MSFSRGAGWCLRVYTCYTIQNYMSHAKISLLSDKAIGKTCVEIYDAYMRT